MRQITMTLLLGLALVQQAAGQQPTQAQANAIRSACRSDYQAHCSNVPTGGSAALACLQQNAANVSPGCQQALAALGGAPTGQSIAPAPTAPQSRPLTSRQEALMVRRSCAQDYRTLCHGVPLGGGRAIACLRDNAQSLAPACRHALASVGQSE